jgi:DNA-binding transcriptional MocR family regulator
MVAELIMGPQTGAKAEFSKKSKKEQSTFTGWSTDGWVRWLAGLRTQYELRMRNMCSVMEEGRFILKQQKSIAAEEDDWAVVSKKEMYTFDWPQGGMFIWARFLFENHPLASKFDGPFLSQCLWVFLTHKPYLVLLAPGTIFSPTEEIKDKEGWKFFRLCFAAVGNEEVEVMSRRFVKGVEAFWRIRDRKVMEKIGKEVNESSVAGEDVVDLSMPWGY